MHKRILILLLLFLTAAVLAFTRPRQHTVYVPFIYWQATSQTACYGQIVGIAYEDINGDGRRDNNEVGLPGIRLRLRPHDTPDVKTVVTDRSGHYLIAVRPGRYELHAAKPSSHRWTTPHSWGIDIVCATIELDFGLEPLPDQREQPLEPPPLTVNNGP